MRAIASKLALVAVSSLFALGLIEVVSRFAQPVSPGTRTLSLAGETIDAVMESRFRHKAELIFRQVSDEFEALVTIDKFGNRIPEPLGNPSVIFLGDSFTFGHGLNDEETFVALYCAHTGLSCVNMGRSGSGTLVQLDVLVHYLETEGWRPEKVMLFVLAMTATLASGNDLLDNYYYARVQEVKATAENAEVAEQAVQEVKAPFHVDIWLKIRRWALDNINLARIVYFRFAPNLRVLLSTPPSTDILGLALEATRVAFDRLRKLSSRYGFEALIYILHPVQDIEGGTDQNTAIAIRDISGGIRVVSTADLFRENSTSYYFAYDGHLNAHGAKRLAEFLQATR